MPQEMCHNAGSPLGFHKAPVARVMILDEAQPHVVDARGKLGKIPTHDFNLTLPGRKANVLIRPRGIIDSFNLHMEVKTKYPCLDLVRRLKRTLWSK